jgi:potassium-transporting ATPase ATP-binding subunit
LRRTRTETPARRLLNAHEERVASTELRKGERFVVEAREIIPADGEIIEGIASVDEAAITGQSAPAIREAGGDRSSVTGGTPMLSDRIVVEVTSDPGERFLDSMIALLEGVSRQKTPNEIALTILLTAIFLIVTVTLLPFGIVVPRWRLWTLPTACSPSQLYPILVPHSTQTLDRHAHLQPRRR